MSDKNQMSHAPTREQLVALLFSDKASEAFEHDALSILQEEIEEAGDRITGGRVAEGLAAVARLIETVGAETSDVGMGLDHENARADLRELKCSALRGAILLLHAAFAAEQALTPRLRPKPPDSPQMSLVDPGPPRKRTRKAAAR